jgi:hypothetical protein
MILNRLFHVPVCDDVVAHALSCFHKHLYSQVDIMVRNKDECDEVDCGVRFAGASGEKNIGEQRANHGHRLSPKSGQRPRDECPQ